MSIYEQTSSDLDTLNETESLDSGLDNTSTQNPPALPKELSDELNRKLNAVVTARLKTFEQKLDKFFASQTVSQTPQQDSKKPEEVDALVEIKQIKAQLAQSQEKEKAARVKASLVNVLASKGVTGEAQRTAILTIMADNLVEVTDDAVLFKTDEGAGTLDSGISEWLQTKPFLVSAKSIAGTGTTSVATNPHKTSTNTQPRPGDLLAQLSKKR